MSEELKPCPFCGNAPGGLAYEGQPATTGGFKMACTTCGARGPNGVPQAAFKLWNNRAAPSSQYVERAMELADGMAHAARCAHAVRDRVDQENVAGLYEAENAARAALRQHLQGN